MKVLRHIEAMTGPTNLTIGNFDGCHLGHQALIKATHQQGVPAVALSFNPRPDTYFGKGPEGLLFSSELKAKCMEELGIDTFIEHPFDAAMAQTSHEDFLELFCKIFY